MTWIRAVDGLEHEGFFDNLPEDLKDAIMAVLATGGKLYDAVTALPGRAGSPALERLAMAMEFASTGIVLQREALTIAGRPAASRLLLGDGFLTLALELVGREPGLDLARFSVVIGQLLGESDPVGSLKEFSRHGVVDLMTEETKKR